MALCVRGFKLNVMNMICFFMTKIHTKFLFHTEEANHNRDMELWKGGYAALLLLHLTLVSKIC